MKRIVFFAHLIPLFLIKDIFNLTHIFLQVNHLMILSIKNQGEKMETRQELEERLEAALSEIMEEVSSRKGCLFAGDLDEAISVLKEVKGILKQLNADDYVSDDDDDDGEMVSGKKNRSDDSEMELSWDDDYEDGY